MKLVSRTDGKAHPGSDRLPRWWAALTFPARWFAAHDLFISYSRTEASGYALELRAVLGKKPHRFSIALDQMESLPGLSTPARVMRHARWSRARVVLATPRALQSKEVRREIDEFGYYPAPLIVVREPGLSIASAAWHKLIQPTRSPDAPSDVAEPQFEIAPGVEPIDEPGGRQAFAGGQASPEVVDAIVLRLDFMRRERRIAVAALVGAVIAVGGAALGAWFGRDASLQRQAAAGARLEAHAAEQSASAARVERAQAQEAAMVASQAADLATAEAASAAASAASASALADAMQARADREARRAADANLQGQAARMGLQAADLLLAAPARLPEALDLASRSVALAPTSGGDAALQRTLALMPPLVGEWNTGCGGRKAAFDQATKIVVTVGFAKLCGIDASLRRALPDKRLDDLLPFGRVDHVAFLADGVLMVVYVPTGKTASRLLLLKPVDDWNELAALELQSRVSAAALSPDGQRIVFGNGDGMLGLLQRRSDGRWEAGHWINALGAHGPITLLHFDRASGRLLVGSRSALELLRSIDLAPGALAERVKIHRIGTNDLPVGAELPAVVDASNGRVLAAWGARLRSFSLPNLEPMQTLPLSGVDAVQLGAEGRVLTHGTDPMLTAFDVRDDGNFVRVSGGERGRDQLTAASELVPAYGGTHVWALGSQNGGVASWASLRRLDGGEEVGRLSHPSYVQHLFPLSDGATVLSIGGDDTIRLWGDVLADNGHSWHDGADVGAVAIDPSAGRAAIGLAPTFLVNPRQVQSWDLRPSMRRGARTWPNRIESLRLADDPASTLDTLGESGWWRAIGWPAGEPALVLAPPPAPTTPVARGLPRCNQHAIAWGGFPLGPVLSGGSGELWLAEGVVGAKPSWRRVALQTFEDQCIEAVAVDAARRVVAVTAIAVRGKSVVSRVAVLSLDSGRMLFERRTPYLVRAMAFDAQARLLAIGTSSAPAGSFGRGRGEVQILSVSDGALRASVAVEGDGPPKAVCLSPDGQRVASEGDSIARVWRLRGAEEPELLTSRTLSDTARVCRFSYDGRRVVFADSHGLRVIVLDRQMLLEQARRRLGPLAAGSAPR